MGAVTQQQRSNWLGRILGCLRTGGSLAALVDVLCKESPGQWEEILHGAKWLEDSRARLSATRRRLRYDWLLCRWVDADYVMAVIRYGGAMPTDIRCGQAFLNAYKAESTTKVDRQLIITPQGGTGMDPSITRVFYKGIELIWDPTFELLDARLGAITYPWTKRCYLLNRNFIKFRPVKGHWMKKRKPEKLPDRYVTYYAQTNKYGMTAKKRNVHAVLSIA